MSLGELFITAQNKMSLVGLYGNYMFLSQGQTATFKEKLCVFIFFICVTLLFPCQIHDKCELTLGIFLPVLVITQRQKVLFCIMPIIILDGSWVTFIKSHAWGRGLIASINLIQPLRDVVVEGRARPDGGRSNPPVLRSLWFSLTVRTLVAAVCWDWQQVSQMLTLIVWLAFPDMVLWLDFYPDMILLLICWFAGRTFAQ